jgi:GNAT superfamily N-acetyltransferase
MFKTEPLTPERWTDLEELFGRNGAVEGCWCMFWRQTGREHAQNAGAENRRRIKAVAEDHVPGLLAYDGGEPVGWCAIAPRAEYPRLGRSPTLKPVDDEPVWSVVCFYIKAGHRRQGVSTRLLEAAVRYAKAQGAKIVEAYPVDPCGGKVANGDAYTGVPELFAAAGFEEVLRRSDTRPIMRVHL